MSTSGVNASAEKIANLINNRLKKEACTEISQCTNPDEAVAIWQVVLNSMKTTYWTRFLKNDHLNHCVTEKDLLFILLKMKKTLAEVWKNPSLAGNQSVLITIIRNERFRKMLGPTPFLSCVKYDVKVTEYIETHFKFMRSFTPEQIARFVKKNGGVKSVLNTLLNAYELKKHRDWAFESIKAIFKTCRESHKWLCLSESFTVFEKKLRDLFDNDVEIAFATLKNPILCENWVKVGFISAYHHPLLESKHYALLSDFYKSKPRLKSTYKLLINQDVLQKFSQLEISEKEELTQSQTYLPSASTPAANPMEVDMVEPKEDKKEKANLGLH